MNERVLRLGSQGHLLGILTPAQGEPEPVAVLILNAGVVHRIGPHRTSVKVARDLSSRGWHCLRFDAAGVGDSAVPRGAADSRSQAVLDLRAVMDGLEAELGIQRFALMGICSGAAQAQDTAVADPRVCGLLLIDGDTYPNWRARLHFALAMWRMYGTGTFGAKLWRRASRAAADARSATRVPIVGPELRRSREDYSREMSLLVARGVSITLMFSGSMLHRHAYDRQLKDVFGKAPWLTGVHCVIERDIDHTVTSSQAQRQLIDRVRRWTDALPRR